MVYHVYIRIFQTDTNTYFCAVEKGSLTPSATWSENEFGELVLTMSGSGTSGAIRFLSYDGKESFIVLLGVHNYVRWVDIAVDLADGEEGTAHAVLPMYYSNEHRHLCENREAQRSSWEVRNSLGRTVSTWYSSERTVSAEEFHLNVNIVIRGKF